MDPPPGPDVREHPRAPARIKVEYNFGSTTGVGYTSDISEGGLFVCCHRMAQPGVRIYLRLHLPGSMSGEPLKIIGSVKRARGSSAAWPGCADDSEGMGIHFEVAYSRTREALSDFIQNLLLQGVPGPDRIRAVPGSSSDQPLYGVQLAPGEAPPQAMSATELDAAFAFVTHSGLPAVQVGAPRRGLGLGLVVLCVLVLAALVVARLSATWPF